MNKILMLACSPVGAVFLTTLVQRGAATPALWRRALEEYAAALPDEEPIAGPRKLPLWAQPGAHYIRQGCGMERVESVNEERTVAAVARLSTSRQGQPPSIDVLTAYDFGVCFPCDDAGKPLSEGLSDASVQWTEIAERVALHAWKCANAGKSEEEWTPEERSRWMTGAKDWIDGHVVFHASHAQARLAARGLAVALGYPVVGYPHLDREATTGGAS